MFPIHALFFGQFTDHAKPLPDPVSWNTVEYTDLAADWNIDICLIFRFPKQTSYFGYTKEKRTQTPEGYKFFQETKYQEFIRMITTLAVETNKQFSYICVFYIVKLTILSKTLVTELQLMLLLKINCESFHFLVTGVRWCAWLTSVVISRKPSLMICLWIWIIHLKFTSHGQFSERNRKWNLQEITEIKHWR